MIALSGITLYPVKGMHRIEVEEAIVERIGLRHDRRWMVVDENDLFRSQRNTPKLAQFQPEIVDDGLVIHFQGESLEARISDARREVTVWKRQVLAHDAGDAAANWLTDRLEAPSRLVRMPTEGDHTVSFADGYPLLLANQASLEDLNRHLEDPVPMTRFRPNVTVAGAEPWAEDHWPELTIGNVRFQNPKMCARCLVTTLDPETGESTGQEPLRTLGQIRLIDGKAMFATNLVPLGEGTIRVGDPVNSFSAS